MSIVYGSTREPAQDAMCILPGAYLQGVFRAWPMTIGGVPLARATAATVEPKPPGVGLTFAGSGTIPKSATAPLWGAVPVVTFVIYCKLKSSNPGATGDFFRSDGSFLVQNTATNKVSVAYWNASDSVLSYWATTSAITWNGRYTVIIGTGGPAWNSGTPKLWIDGTLQSLTKSTGTPAGTNVAAPSKVLCAGGTESDTEWLNGSTLFYCVPVLRELADWEIKFISQNPWSIFEADPISRVGVSTATVPYWAFAGNNSVIGVGVH